MAYCSAPALLGGGAAACQRKACTDAGRREAVIKVRPYADRVRWDADVFRDNLSEHYGPVTTQVLEKVSVWLARGDGVAVYEDSEFSSPGRGDWKVTSYGSPAAQIVAEHPPIRLPDGVGGKDAINWRFVLVGTYRAKEEAESAGKGNRDVRPKSSGRA